MATSQSGSPFDCKTQDAIRRQRSCDEADSGETARISTHVFIDKSVNIKGLSGTPLSVAILAAELACKAHVIREASGTYDGGEDVTGAAGGRQSEKVTNVAHGLTGTDPAYVGNEAFWAMMRATQKNWNYLGVTERRAWPVIGQSLAIRGKGPIGDDPAQQIQGEFTVKYNHLDPIVSIPIDIDKLNEAPFLPFVSIVTQGSNAATLASTPSLETAVIAVGENMIVKATFTGGVEYSLRGENGDPLGISAVIDPVTGVLTFTPVVGEVGEHLVYVRAESACGILGEVQLRITVTP
jgi:hypothetical protein